MSDKCLLIYVGQSDMNFTLAGKRNYDMKREPQIGFAYLGAVLRQHYVDSEVLDFTIHSQTKESLNDYIAKNSPVFIGFYAAAAIKERVIDYVHSVRNEFPKLKIFAGGADTFDPEDYLTTGVDIFCLGEGERTIVDLFKYCRDEIKREHIQGVVYKENNEFHYTSPRELIENLDELPLPAWDMFDLTKYYDYHIFDMVQPYTTIMASRGCPFNCSYCISPKIWRRNCRRRSVGNVLKEIDYLVKERGVRYIMFQDDIWSLLDNNWAREICRELIKRKYNLRWRCILHPMSFLNCRQEILPLMKAAGCTSVTIGLQSASKQILRNINRNPDQPEALADLIRGCKKAGLLNSVEFIVGLPGDTEETVEETIQFALKVKPTFCAFYSLTVLVGSDIWHDQKAGRFQSLPDSFTHRKCKEAARRFYTNPGVLYNTLGSIIRANPAWLFKALGNLKYLLQLSGVLGKSL